MTSLQAARLATMLLLFCNGLIYATWGIHIPTLKAKFELSDADLSWAMFAVAVGGIVVMSRVGRWAERRGTAHVSRHSAWLMGGTAALILIIPQYDWVLLWLLLFGAATAANDIAVNAQGAMLEVRMNRPIIGSIHGSFSLGGLVGALIASVWVATQGTAISHMVLVSLLMALLMLFAARHLITDDDNHKSRYQDNDNNQAITKPLPSTAVAIPPHVGLRLWALGGLGFLGLLVEGAMYDWSAVYMREVVAASPEMVSAGYGAFCAGMALGRFAGDPLRGRLGALQLMYGSCALAMVGLLLAMLWPKPLSATIGFGLAGLGLSSVMPILFASAGKIASAAGLATAVGLAVTVRCAYAGLLLGPALLGQISQGFGLVVALGIAVLSVVLIAGFCRPLLKHST